jgi:hypothetical protein
MNRAQSFIDRVEANGGKLRVEGDRLHCDNPEAIGPYLPELTGCKDAVIQLVRERGTDAASSQDDPILRLIRERRGR